MSRKINQRGLDLVTHFEGLQLKAYEDEVGVWTIGWGHTGLVHNDGTVYAGRTITRKEAEALLRHDMEQFEQAVSRNVSAELTDDQFAALVSFAFNLGEGNLKSSTLLKRVNGLDYWGAANEFEKWNRAGGKVLRGLTRRRQSERNLFCGFPRYLVPA